MKASLDRNDLRNNRYPHFSIETKALYEFGGLKSKLSLNGDPLVEKVGLKFRIQNQSGLNQEDPIHHFMLSLMAGLLSRMN